MAQPTGTAADAEAFRRFVQAVSRQQLDAWLPGDRQRILDLSAGCPELLSLIVARGHDVVHAGAEPVGVVAGPGRLRVVAADPRRPEWVAPGSVDAIVAEGGVLSTALATEVTLEDLHAALRPGGRLLLAVDSLLAGLADLAGQGRWAELTDVPSADVVLVPRPGGQVTRCFWPEELAAMLTSGGFAVEWVRPRTVLSAETVTRALRADPARLPELVATELRLAVERQGGSIGATLVASAVRP